MKFRHPPMRSTSPVLVLICRIRFAHLGGQRRPTAACRLLISPPSFGPWLTIQIAIGAEHSIHPLPCHFPDFLGTSIWILIQMMIHKETQEEWVVMPRICKVELYRCFQSVLPPTWIQYLPATPVLVIWFTISKPNTVTKFLQKKIKKEWKACNFLESWWHPDKNVRQMASWDFPDCSKPWIQFAA